MKRRKVDFKQEMLMMLVFSSRDKKKKGLTSRTLSLMIPSPSLSKALKAPAGETQ